jgi:UDP-N-acetylenolpyruvoylglucosamine reductase
LGTFILGGGSNVLSPTKASADWFCSVALKGISTVREKGEISYVTAKAGEDWDASAVLRRKNLQGVSNV